MAQHIGGRFDRNCGNLIMWIFWIVSTVIGLDEPKVTRYAEFDSEQVCQTELNKVKHEFKKNEIAFCQKFIIENYILNSKFLKKELEIDG